MVRQARTKGSERGLALVVDIRTLQLLLGLHLMTAFRVSLGATWILLAAKTRGTAKHAPLACM